MKSTFDPSIIARLEGLQTALRTELAADVRRRYWDSKLVLYMFQAYRNILSELVNSHPSVFADISKKESAPEKENTYHRPQLQDLLNNVETLLVMMNAYSSTMAVVPTVTREGIFFAGQTFDALRSVQNLVESAKFKIWLIDNYVDPSVLDIFTLKRPPVNVFVLTKDISIPMRDAAKKFNEQYGHLDIRESEEFHDRWLCIDDREFYHFGASIKDLGRKGCMYSRIDEPDTTSGLQTRFHKVWSNSKSGL